MHILTSLMLVAVTFFSAVDALATSYSVIDIGALGRAGSAAGYSLGNGINHSGDVVGCGATGGFIYTAGAVREMAFCPSSISANGIITGSNYETGNAVISEKGTITVLGTLGGRSSAGCDVNNAGDVTGWSNINDNHMLYHAFVYSKGTLMDIGSLGGSSYGNAINSRGEVAGYSYIAGNTIHAFIYTSAGLIDIGTLGGETSYAFGINEAGDVVGYSDIASGGARAFLYSKGKMVSLGTLGYGSYAYAVNDRGQVVGHSGTSAGRGQHAFLYSHGKMHDLNDLIPSDSGWELTLATGINNRGEITGAGYINGVSHAFVLRPISPAPVDE